MQGRSILRSTFQKRSFTFNSFSRALATVVRDARGIIQTFLSKRITRSFSEKIMMAVTSVNGCRYCSHVHTKMALENGCSPREIQEILAHDLHDCREDEVIALAFAQHYAETKDAPSKDAYQRMTKFYGRARARDILHYIQMITIGNLAGNTLDAFRSRLNGRPSENGSWFCEFLFYLIGAPIGFMILKF